MVLKHKYEIDTNKYELRILISEVKIIYVLA